MANNPVRAIAARLSDQLRTGSAPWQQVWQSGSPYLPMNPATGQPYRAMNAVSLTSAMIEGGFSDPRWMTAVQAERLGGTVQADAKPETVIAWQFEERLSDGKMVKLEKPRMLLREVFNAQQIDGLPPFEAPSISPEDAQARVGAIARGSKAVIVIDANGGSARYDADRDTVLLKDRSDGAGQEFANLELMHALGHWTGYSSRFNRDLSHPTGSAGHAKEELRTNVASLMLGDRLGIGWHPGTHAALGEQWADILDADPAELLRACRDAEAIAGNLIELGHERAQEQAREMPERETLISRDHPMLERPENAGRRTYTNGPVC